MARAIMAGAAIVAIEEKRSRRYKMAFVKNMAGAGSRTTKNVMTDMLAH